MADIREITDFSAPELDIFARLKESRLTNWECEERGIFIAESPKVIGRAMAAGYEPVSFLMERRHVESQGKALLAQCGAVPVFTAEEHSTIGGLGGMIAELASEKCPRPVYRIGLQDVFAESGAAKDLMHKYGLDGEGVAAFIRNRLK